MDRTHLNAGARSRGSKKKSYTGRNKKTVKAAKSRLTNFRRATLLAVSITGFLLILFSIKGNDALSDTETANLLIAADNPVQSDTSASQEPKSTEEAIGVLQKHWENFLFLAPKLLIALGFILLSWLLIRIMSYILRKGMQKIPSYRGIIAMVTIAYWILVVGVVFSIIAGDMRALIGSIGLVGLVLSWALQTPIESFTGWLLNAFNHYYRIGDRVKVGEVFGDVYKIDYLTTTIWEIGSPSQSGYVNAEQPTGRLVTFPNHEILAGSVVNLTGDFPYVWDELLFSITNESDIKHAMHVLKEASDTIIGDYMKKPILQYTRILQKAGLPSDLPTTPQVYSSPGKSWVDLTIRYLVGARERRVWKTKLFLHISEVLAQKENKESIFPVYPRYQVQLMTDHGQT